MKRNFNVVVVLLLVVVGVLLWTIGRVRRASAPTTVITMMVPTVEPTVVAPKLTSPPAAVPPAQPAVAPPAVVAAPQVNSPNPADPSKYVAKPGDTIADLAAALPGGDQKINRDAVIEANPSLQWNPDRVLAGKAYKIPTADVTAAAPAQPSSAKIEPATGVETPETDVHELKYNARPGDTVSTLASALLGSNSKDNRDAIVEANASLQADPDHLIANKTYHIPVSAGQPLAAAPDADVATARPATQPDADAVVQEGSGRELRYVAQPGDTVATLATALLGSDTKENAAAIINSNASLRQNPDRVIAGKTYWIPAPTASQQN